MAKLNTKEQGALDLILDDITIIVDTREQKNAHIINYLLLHGIDYKEQTLKSGDYSFILPNHSELGFDYSTLIEKKNSLTEIAGNFTKGRTRFNNEFSRVEPWQDIHLLIEGATWKKVANGSYRSNLEPNSMKASLISWGIRYNTPIWFVGKEESPDLIYNIIKYSIREKFINYLLTKGK